MIPGHIMGITTMRKAWSRVAPSAAELRRTLGKLRIKQTKILLRMGTNPNNDSKEDDLFGLLH